MFTKRKPLAALLGAVLVFAATGQPLAAPASASENDPPADTEALATPDGSSTDEAAEDTPNWQEGTLTGDWGGARKQLYDAGLQADLVYTADYLRNNRGGITHGGAYMGHVDLILQVNGDKLFGWRGGSAYLHVISNGGGRVNLNYVGSLMGVDNIEAPVNRSGIFKAWLQQLLFDDKASLRVGLYPIDSEFYVTDSSGVFLHPSFGMAAETANFGSLAGPSIYPTSSYAARLRIDPDPAWYAMLAISRGLPSDRVATAGPNISWPKGVGSMLIGEIGFSPLKAGLLQDQPASQEKSDFEPISKLAIGMWRYAPRFPQLVAVDALGEPLLATHWGGYLLLEQTVFRVPDSNRDLTAFFRYGFTDGKTNAIDYSVSGGLSLRGPFAGREKDIFGIAATRAHVGPQGRSQLADELGEPLSSAAETAVEMTYRAQITPGVTLQPVIQRVVNPGLGLPNATLAGVRLQLAL
ncbi:carbohydrate porin [Accumulibacter sp.]|uniref:carbohydrate porin n=1 Tax=Accumulibacter sp. TaxID=2053492 RepID=UPI00262FB46D|nr:carbohydrate porin [Accumulibacter sp.]